MEIAEHPDVKRWRMTSISYARHYGENDPRTVQARRELALARVAVAEAELARRRAELDALEATAA